MLNHQPPGDFSPFSPMRAFLDVSGNFRLSLSHFALFLHRVDGSNLQVAGFLAGCKHLMRTLKSSINFCIATVY